MQGTDCHDYINNKDWRYSHEPVHGPEERHILHRRVDSGEYDDHEDQGSAGYRGAGNAGRGGGEPEVLLYRGGDEEACRHNHRIIGYYRVR